MDCFHGGWCHRTDLPLFSRISIICFIDYLGTVGKVFGMCILLGFGFWFLVFGILITRFPGPVQVQSQVHDQQIPHTLFHSICMYYIYVLCMIKW